MQTEDRKTSSKMHPVEAQSQEDTTEEERAVTKAATLVLRKKEIPHYLFSENVSASSKPYTTKSLVKAGFKK